MTHARLRAARATTEGVEERYNACGATQYRGTPSGVLGFFKGRWKWDES
jgi:hypothetical protein